jgi:hypothetical protein
LTLFFSNDHENLFKKVNERFYESDTMMTLIRFWWNASNWKSAVADNNRSTIIISTTSSLVKLSVSNELDWIMKLYMSDEISNVIEILNEMFQKRLFLSESNVTRRSNTESLMRFYASKSLNFESNFAVIRIFLSSNELMIDWLTSNLTIIWKIKNYMIKPMMLIWVLNSLLLWKRFKLRIENIMLKISAIWMKWDIFENRLRIKTYSQLNS